MGRTRTSKKRSVSSTPEEEILLPTSLKRRILPRVEVRIFRAPSPASCLNSTPIAPRSLRSHPLRSGSPISNVNASTPQSSESSQKSWPQHRYPTRSRVPVPIRTTRDIASHLIRTVSPELGDPTFHTPYEERVNQSKLTPDIVSALRYLHRRDIAHFHKLSIDDVSIPVSPRPGFDSVQVASHPSTYEKKRDSSEAADQEIGPVPGGKAEFEERTPSLQQSLSRVFDMLEEDAVESTFSKNGSSSGTHSHELVQDSSDASTALKTSSKNHHDHGSIQNPIQDYSPTEAGIKSTLDCDGHVHTLQSPTTFDGVPSAVWFWGRVRGHARYSDFDEDRFRRICREYMENTRHGLSNNKSDAKAEYDPGDIQILETGVEHNYNMSEASTIILETSTKTGDSSKASSQYDVLSESNHSTLPRVNQPPSSEPSLGPSTQNEIRANVNLPFMRALCDENNFDNILSRLDNASLINVTRATTLIPSSHIQRKYWDIDQAFIDCLGPRGREFRRVLFETDALVTGPFALRFFSRLKTSQVAMDVFVPKERYRNLIDHIRHVQKFNWEACEGVEHTNRLMRDVVRSITRFCKAETKVSVFCTQDIPLRALLCCVSNSSLLNIISHSKAYSLFPRETFTNGRLQYFQGPKSPRQSDVGPAAASWEWQGVHLIEYETITTRLSSPEFQKTRRIGDRYTWTISFTTLLVPTPEDVISDQPGKLERHTFQLESGSPELCGLCQESRSKNLEVKHSHTSVTTASNLSSLASNDQYVCEASPWSHELGERYNLDAARQIDIAIRKICLIVASVIDSDKDRIRDMMTGDFPGKLFDEMLRTWHQSVKHMCLPKDWKLSDDDTNGWYKAWCSSPQNRPSNSSAATSFVTEPISVRQPATLSLSRGLADESPPNYPDPSDLRPSNRSTNDDEEHPVFKQGLFNNDQPERLSSIEMTAYDTSAAPHIKVEPERPPTSIPIPPSRGFLRDMRDHGVAQIPPPGGEWDAGVLFGSESEDDSDGELPGGHLYEERRQVRIRLEKEAAESGPDPFIGLSRTQRRQRVHRLEEQRLRMSGRIQASSQDQTTGRAIGKRSARQLEEKDAMV